MSGRKENISYYEYIKQGGKHLLSGSGNIHFLVEVTQIGKMRNRFSKKCYVCVCVYICTHTYVIINMVYILVKYLKYSVIKMLRVTQ